eukprot:s119_g50.t1
MAPTSSKTERLAVCRFVQKLAMFGVAVGVYFSVKASEYPARWLHEDTGFFVFEKTRRCLVIWGSAPEDFDPVAPLQEFLQELQESQQEAYDIRELGQMTRTSLSRVQSQNCGFMPGSLLVAKRRKDFVRIARKLGPICSLIPYFFYIPLNTQKSEDNQIWIRFPAFYQGATTFLFLTAFVIVLNVACVGMIHCCRGTTLQDVSCAFIAAFLFCVLLCLVVVIALVADFSLAFSFDFDFRLDFSFSIYLEVLKVLTWVSLTTDLVAGLICLHWMCKGCPAADEDESRV